MNCPADSSRLDELKEYDLFLSVCPSCKGVWVDAEEFKPIAKKLEEGDLGETFKNWKNTLAHEHPPLQMWQEPIRGCPHDYTQMIKHPFAGDSRIILDVCEKCGGFWLDGVDISRMIEYLKPNEAKDILAQTIAGANPVPSHVEDELKSIKFMINYMSFLPGGTLAYKVVLSLISFILREKVDNK